MRLSIMRWAGFLALVLVLLTLGHFIIPAHTISIWMDREFTDWISPIANRLHGQSRLYDTGLHSPMPPLPFVLLRLLHPNGAIWLDESLLHFVFQAATLLLLYHVFSKLIGVALAFASTMAAIPVFLCLPKSILYDPMAQFLVVASAATCAQLLRINLAAGKNFPNRSHYLLAALLGTLLALTLLTKQNTGIGATMGVCGALVFIPAQTSFVRRLFFVSSLLLFVFLATCVILLALNQFISFSGLIHDVVLTGSEPKGGPFHLLHNFVHYGRQIAVTTLKIGAFLMVISWVSNRQMPLRKRFSLFETIFLSWENAADPVTKRDRQLIITALIIPVATCLCLYFLTRIQANPPPSDWLIWLVRAGLDLGLVIILYLGSVVLFQRRSPAAHDLTRHPLTPFAMVFLPAALFHCLSVGGFRWTYDNNPLIVLAFVFVLRPLFTLQGAKNSLDQKWMPVAKLALVGVALVGAWLLLPVQMASVLRCTESWPEVKHLAGARLRPEAGGMRELIQSVRSLANPTNNETVLLLPNDPNVEAWFDRQRPNLSSAIIFTDQYWDRYVSQDFAELEAHPPAVIVIGPRNLWRPFARQWHINQGAERLIDLVNNRLIPASYQLQAAHPISFADTTEFMDVYVRRKP